MYQMRRWFPFLFLCYTLLCLSLPATAQQECSHPFLSSDPTLLSRHHPTNQTALQVQTTYSQILQAGYRLEYRAMSISPHQWRIPLMPINSEGLSLQQASWIDFPASIVTSIVAHIHQAIEQGYAQFPIFSDMGHGHLYLPQNKAQSLLSSSSPSDRWHSLLADPDLVILYHTRENYDLQEASTDPQIAHYNNTRNLLGSINSDPHVSVLAGPGGIPNTARIIEGYSSVGAIYFSATHKGCFPLNENLFLDFSLMSPSVEQKEPPSTPPPLGGK